MTPDEAARIRQDQDYHMPIAFRFCRFLKRLATRHGLRRSQTRRLRSVTMPLTIQIGDGKHDLAVCLAYDANDRLHEINLVSRGKIGHHMDLMLHDLGIKLSRAVQGRDPDTGKPIEDPTVKP